MRQEVVIANPAIITDDGLERSIIQEGLGGGVQDFTGQGIRW